MTLVLLKVQHHQNLYLCILHLFILQRDEEDTAKLVTNCPPEFKEYYIQMQAAKRSQAPHPSQVTGSF